MGRPKLAIPFGDEPMLARVVRLVREVAEPVVVVAAAEQQLPALPPDVLVARDRRPDQGPLEGVAVGLAAIRNQSAVAFVTACDVPLLLPAFVRRIIELAQGYDIAIPYVNGFYEPLAAVYRMSVLPHVEQLLAAGRLRPVELLENVRTRRIEPAELRDVDPQLQSLANINSPADYEAALQRAGFPRGRGASSA